MNKTLKQQLADIKPGETYPSYVKITEDKQPVIEFHLCSYVVGMYCAVHLDGKTMPVVQTGDHDNKKFVAGLKRDINKAIKRGATVEISRIFPVKHI